MAEYDHELSRIVEELNRARPVRVPPSGLLPRGPQTGGSLDQLWFRRRQNASDVLLIAGTPVACA